MYHRVDRVFTQRPVHHKGEPVNSKAQKIGKAGADHVEGQIKHQKHHREEHGESGIFAGQHPVDLHGAQMLPALMALDHRDGHHLFNKGVAHIRQGCVAVEPGLVLHLHDTVLDQLPLVPIQLKLIGHVGIVLNELCGAEAGGDPQLVRVILNQVDHRVDAAVDR